MNKFAVTWYTQKFYNLPEEFKGFCIAIVADLHNKNFGGELEKEIVKAKPDIIALVGDLVHKEFEYGNAMKFIENATKIAPVYFVNGNHEGRFKTYRQLSETLQNLGVIVLEDKAILLQQGDSQIALLGINDPKFFKNNDDFKKKLSELCKKVENRFKVLLSHRPEFFPFYADCGIDLTVSGHAHGGQIRLPFIGALYAPGQGIFPKYAKGVYFRNDKYIAVSGGLGHTRKTLPRIMNRPELVLIRFDKQSDPF